MIIKSLSRKDPTFSQLSGYITAEADKDFTYSRNIYVDDLNNLNEVNKEFKENHKFLNRQRNSNALYHEIISITKSDIDIKLQKEALFNIVDEYVKIRADKCFVYGSLHEAHNNIHFHLMISSNEVEQTKNHYLSTKEFSDIKKGLEKHVLEKYPELKQKVVINNKTKKSKSKSEKEFEYTKRTGKKTQKEIIKEKLSDVFKNSKTKQNFFDNLYLKNFEIYTRGKTVGFIDTKTGRKHRLKTLALENEFKSMSDQIELNNKINGEDSKKDTTKQNDFAEKKKNKPSGDEIKKESKKSASFENKKDNSTEKTKTSPQKKTINKKENEKQEAVKKRKEFLKEARNQINKNKDKGKNNVI